MLDYSTLDTILLSGDLKPHPEFCCDNESIDTPFLYAIPGKLCGNECTLLLGETRRYHHECAKKRFERLFWVCECRQHSRKDINTFYFPRDKGVGTRCFWCAHNKCEKND